MPDRMQQTARAIMSADVPMLDEVASISEAVQHLADRDTGCTIIVDDDRRPAGIITEPDGDGRLSRLVTRQDVIRAIADTP